MENKLNDLSPFYGSMVFAFLYQGANGIRVDKELLKLIYKNDSTELKIENTDNKKDSADFLLYNGATIYLSEDKKAVYIIQEPECILMYLDGKKIMVSKNPAKIMGIVQEKKFVFEKNNGEKLIACNNNDIHDEKEMIDEYDNNSINQDDDLMQNKSNNGLNYSNIDDVKDINEDKDNNVLQGGDNNKEEEEKNKNIHFNNNNFLSRKGEDLRNKDNEPQLKSFYTESGAEEKKKEVSGTHELLNQANQDASQQRNTGNIIGNNSKLKLEGYELTTNNGCGCNLDCFGCLKSIFK